MRLRLKTVYKHGKEIMKAVALLGKVKSSFSPYSYKEDVEKREMMEAMFATSIRDTFKDK